MYCVFTQDPLFTARLDTVVLFAFGYMHTHLSVAGFVGVLDDGILVNSLHEPVGQLQLQTGVEINLSGHRKRKRKKLVQGCAVLSRI